MKTHMWILMLALTAMALATSAARADVYSWTGTTSTDWTDSANWSGPAGIPDDASDTALFDTGGSSSFTATNIPNPILPLARLIGNGSVDFGSGTTRIQFRGGFYAGDGVDLQIGRFYPEDAGSEWNSTGTLDTTPSGDIYSMYFNDNNATFTQKKGAVSVNGSRFFRRSNCHYVLEDGELQTLALFASEGYANNSIDLNGGDLTQNGDMVMKSSVINLTDGVFQIDGGKLTSFGTGYLNFISTGLASFASENTQPEIEAYVTAGNIRIDGVSAAVADFKITSAAGVTTMTLIPEPSSLALAALGLFGLLTCIRRHGR